MRRCTIEELSLVSGGFTGSKPVGIANCHGTAQVVLYPDGSMEARQPSMERTPIYREPGESPRESAASYCLANGSLPSLGGVGQLK